MLKTTGRMAALLLVSGVVGVVLFGVLRARKGAGTGSVDQRVRDFGAPPAVDDAGSEGSSPQDLIALADEGAWTRVDAATGRVKFRMTWKRLDPEAAGEFRIDRPRLWMIEDGRTIRMEASAARVVWPSRDEAPESGEMSGGVSITAFEREGMDDAALRGAEVLGTVRTATLGFVQAARELRTGERVEVEGRGVRASGEGMTLRLGADRARPISLLRIEQAGRVEYSPEEAKKAAREAGERGGAGDSTAGEVAFYRLAVAGAVRLESGGRSASAEDVTAWARLVNGRLRDGAIGGDEARGGAGDSASSAAAVETGDDVVVTWGGSLELRALGDEPTELGGEDVLVRMKAGESEVEFADARSDRRAWARQVEYGATSRRARADGLRVERGGAESARVEQIDLSLTTGEGVVAGGGEAWSGAPGERASRGATWREGAEFTLDTAARDAAVKSVKLMGGATLTGDGATLEAHAVRAEFATGGGDGAPGSRIARLSASGGARGRDAKGGEVGGETIDVLFEPTAQGDAVPTVAAVRGGAYARREGESLRGELIEATLGRAADGDVEVATVEAREGVAAEIARDGATITAKADTLRADARMEVAEFVGEPVRITRIAGDGEGELSGRSMRMEAKEGSQRLTVFGEGAGRFAGANGGQKVEVEVDWKGGVVYDDTRGRAEIEGATEARVAVGADERHVARGSRMEIGLTPADAARERGGERELVRAMIEGAGEVPAEVELRRYVPGTLNGGEPTLEGLALLRGPTVELMNGAGLLRVEGAGVLLLEDRRSAEARPTKAGPIEMGGVRGTTLFTWQGGMTLDRGAGTGVLADDVLIRHRDAGTGEIAEVACHRAEIRFVESPGGGEGMTLTRAEASGGVTGRSGVLQLSGSRLMYDATGRIVLASEPGGSVTLYDEAKGQPISGEAAIVDMATGVYRIERLESVALPR